jgi:O-antigen/teichoic acid export membrane protein
MKRLGVDNFGLLSLSWTLLGYFTLFDLGFGRATTKFVAEELQNGVTERLRDLFWTSAWTNCLLGIVGGVVVAAAASTFAGEVFRIPPDLLQKSETAFVILGVSCPVILISIAFRGALEAAQRFDYVNAVSVVFSSLTFLLPLLGVLLGLDILGIIILLMISKTCSAMVYLLLCFRVFPVLTTSVKTKLWSFKRLFSFGGWVSISNGLQPLLCYFDRFLIGSMISIAAVAYYVTPFDTVTRLSILPTSLTMALFPTFAATGTLDRERLTSLSSRSVKFILMLVGPLAAVLILFAGDILQVWLGHEFATVSAIVMRILALGILVNSLSQVPYYLILGLGRPDITAKFHIIELLLYIPLAWILVKSFGIAGGAWAWTIRVTIDAILLFAASGKFVDFREFFELGLRRGIVAAIALLLLLALSLQIDVGIVVKAAVAVAMLTVFSIAAWKFVFSVGERDLLLSTIRQLKGLVKG